MEWSKQERAGCEQAADMGRGRTAEALWAVVRRLDFILEGMGVCGE